MAHSVSLTSENPLLPKSVVVLCAALCFSQNLAFSATLCGSIPHLRKERLCRTSFPRPILKRMP